MYAQCILFLRDCLAGAAILWWQGQQEGYWAIRYFWQHMATYKKNLEELCRQLQLRYDSGEAAAIARLFLQSATGLTPIQALTRNEDIPLITQGIIDRGMQQLALGRPLQYVLGRTDFCGRPFLIDERALIPRPETEELVAWIIADCKNRNAFSILDVGTGSGCIALSLAGELPQAAVTGLDISPESLSLARENARRLDLPASFLQTDFLNAGTWDSLPTVHILVSNPPYIPAAERETLEAHVREWEPAAALFVPDGDPLIFYRALSGFGLRKLPAGGALYCETHRDYAAAVAALFQSDGWAEADLKEDAFGEPRMVKALKR